ncbi:hypothetical protein ACTMTI_40110 [Nonomuraea sp. H19]|uniref:hypothetical protein n=1 Tax=Nonomuraea sp. H19 TaxID=3452206 RepID=UPI003F890AA1
MLEEQAAAYTTLTIPAELQVNLENQRSKIDHLEQRLSGKVPRLQLKELPDWTGSRTLQEIMDYLSLYCEPSLVNAVMKQVVLASAYRRSFRWNMTLQPNRRRRPPADEAIDAALNYSFEQIASTHIAEESMRSYAVYHVPSPLSQRGRLQRMTIDSHGNAPIDLAGDELERYAERSAYGCFYRVPYNLRRGQSAKVSAEVEVFHPVRSEEILVSYYPCTNYTATVRLPVEHAKRFQLRVEFWHPSRSGEWMADEVVTQDGYEVSTYRITEPLLPYQGLRIAWHYR